LDPHSLPKPRTINPAISTRVADAILWAMALHPDDRPVDVSQFIKALTGETTASLRNGYSNGIPRRQAKIGALEQRLIAIAASLGFLTLLLTLLRNL
jgi:serine/threonine-protein kinase